MARHFGRTAPHNARTHPRLRLGDFLRQSQLPPIPPVIDYLSKVSNWPMYLNDQIGDCTCAAAGHMIEAFTAYGQGTADTVTDNDVLHAYEAVSGYNADDPFTDQGANMQDVLTYWRKTGIGSHKILAFAELDIANPAELQAALYLFGHLYVGLNVPQSAEDQFDAGKPWDVVADDGGILGGHAVNVGARDSATQTRLITWGAVQEMTKAFWEKYVEEAWIAIDQEWVNANSSSPEGLDVVALGEAFTELTGQASPFPAVTPPAPTPGPAPTPEPTPDDLLAAVIKLWNELKAWATGRHTGSNKKAADTVKQFAEDQGLA